MGKIGLGKIDFVEVGEEMEGWKSLDFVVKVYGVSFIRGVVRDGRRKMMLEGLV